MSKLKTRKETKISAENAEKIFLEIKKAFCFNVKESKVRKITIDTKAGKAETTEEYDPIADILEMIKEGKVEFDSEKTVIKFNLNNTVEAADGRKFKVIEFGTFTRNKQKRVGNLAELDIGTMEDDDLDSLFCVMTGVSDPADFGELHNSEILSMRSIAALFFA